MAGGWSIKAMHRLIMLSATYQLSSDHDSRAAEVDPADELTLAVPAAAASTPNRSATRS